LAPEHLFVYGTLRTGSDNRFARMLAERARSIGPAQVPGRLYDLGSYPGARPGGGSIQGEIFQLHDPAAILAKLDRYEGPEYERAVTVANGIECWIYWYVGPEPGRLIASGHWFER
jgi:gamma-glutamylcyclotransferase (GGCT)/AIG2-like uncharacterized protein YtfP